MSAFEILKYLKFFFEYPSGVGTAAIQLAKLFGAKVATTAGSNEKLAYCQKLGADKAVSYKDGPW